MLQISGSMHPVLRFALVSGIILAQPRASRSEPEATFPACYATGGGALEVCRSPGEPEGVFYVPPACRMASEVQLLRLQGIIAPGPLQVIHDAEPKLDPQPEPRQKRRRRRDENQDRAQASEASCAEDSGGSELGHSVRSGRQVEALATTMPATDYRFWSQRETRDQPRRRRRARRGREEEATQPSPPDAEAGVSRSPMAVAGRDWAGDDYFYVFMVGAQQTGQARRHVLLQARTYDFATFDVRAAGEGATGIGWLPFAQVQAGENKHKARRSRRRRGESTPSILKPAPVLDAKGEPILANCAAADSDARGLSGSISVVDRTYHYFYTDVLASDCNEPPAKRRVGLYLRTSRDLGEEQVWSAPTTVVEGLPADTTVKVAKARSMERWAVAYSCFRPANAPGGPVADICLQYTKDLSVGAIGALTFFAEPAEAVRSPAFLGLRSGGDASGRFRREGLSWMTDRYGNLDTPTAYSGKGGFLTWTDARVPGAANAKGHPVYWSTWTVRPR